MNKLKVLEGFAGVGSQRMALRNIGVKFESVGIMDIDKDAIVGYSAIHENIIDDIEQRTDEEMYKYLFDKGVGMNFTKEMMYQELVNDILKCFNGNQ